jgi:putative ABC transport system substrate-binding protein
MMPFWIFDSSAWFRTGFRFSIGRCVRKKIFYLALSAVLFAPCVSIEAQQPKKVPRIGVLAAATPATVAHLIEAFKQGLREHGYVEGQNVVLELRFAEAKPEAFPVLAAELVRLKVDVILALTNPMIEAAKQATQTIPIVSPNSSDPVGSGFAASLARPGTNFTGLSTYSPELNGKRLELLKETVAKLARVAVLLSPNFPGGALDLKETEAAARPLRLRIQPLEVRDVSDIDRAFAAITKERADAVTMFPGRPVFFVNRKKIVGLAAKNRTPVMYALDEFVVAGGLMSYGPDRSVTYQRAATYVDKILKGATPGELPIEQPTKFEFIVNLKAAKQIGLTIPPNVLARADRVIR